MDQEKMRRHNLRIMWFANFFVGGSMTSVLPFISLYIESFGNFSERYVQHWAGLTFGITFVSALPSHQFGEKSAIVMEGKRYSFILD